MNYRHAFHAGNFADVLKHAALVLILDYLRLKEAPLFLLDSHAGRGVYDLSGSDARKTEEWQGGIARLRASTPPANVAIALHSYFTAIKGFNPQGGGRTYPGSPALMKSLLRPQDRALFCEAHPGEVRRLRRLCAGESRIAVVEGDGYEALIRALPPRERRALILIDPPYEAKDEFDVIALAVKQALRRFAHGCYVVWYPLTANRDSADGFLATLAALQRDKTLKVELGVRAPDESGLIGCGLALINPPYTLEAHLHALLPWLAQSLGEDGHGRYLLAPLS